MEPLRRIRPATMLLVAACSIGSPKTQANLKAVVQDRGGKVKEGKEGQDEMRRAELWSDQVNHCAAQYVVSNTDTCRQKNRRERQQTAIN